MMFLLSGLMETEKVKILALKSFRSVKQVCK